MGPETLQYCIQISIKLFKDQYYTREKAPE